MKLQIKPALTIIAAAIAIAGCTTAENEYLENREGLAKWIANNGDTITVIMEQTPKFPGGKDSVIAFINKEISSALQNHDGKIGTTDDKTTKTVYVKYVVNQDGGIVNVESMKSSGDSILDSYAMQAIEKLPAWTPGSSAGKPVRVAYTIAVRYTVTDDGKIGFTTDPQTGYGYRIDNYYSGNQIWFTTNSTPSPYAGYSVEQISECDELPGYPGGIKSLFEYIEKNIAPAQKSNDREFEITLTIESDGTPRPAADTDEQTARAIENMPKWQPGQLNGKATAVTIRLTL